MFSQTAIEYFNKGKIFQDQGLWYEAIEQYQEALLKNPAYGEAYYSLAQCSYSVEEFNLCLMYLDSADKLLRNRPELQNLRGFAYIGLSRIADAKAIFEDVLIKYPNNVDARYGLAELDILNGRVSGAEDQLQKALQRQNTNKVTLLSLALVSDELGKTKVANDYIKQALKYHNGSPEVYYFAAYLAAKEGKLSDAEKYVRSAIQLNNNYEIAYALLSNILYDSKRYEEAIEICLYRIAQNREDAEAWYLRGLCLESLGKFEEAISVWQTGLSVDPQDEIMRASLELLALEVTDVEDSRRINWSEYHTNMATDYLKKYSSVQARYEYQRALRINPLDSESRLAYASLLLSDGYPESYLSQLEFVNEQDTTSTEIKDTIESYKSLLRNSLPLQWGVDPFYLEKIRWNIGIYYINPQKELLHKSITKKAALYLSDIFSTSSEIRASVDTVPVSSYTAAFSQARNKKQDYFCMLAVEETDRDITVSVSLYSGRTGRVAGQWTVYRTGNNSFSNAIDRMKQVISNALPHYGTILARHGTDVLVDMGRKNGVAVDQVWNIVMKGSISTSDIGIEITYPDNAVLGTVKITAVGEDISEGIISQRGFYDKINIGDLLVMVPTLEEDATEASKTETSTTEESNSIEQQSPSLLQLLRTIR